MRLLRLLHFGILGMAALLVLGPAGTAAADDAGWLADGPAQLSFGIGYSDVIDRDDDAADLRLEYRHAEPVLAVFRPWAGVEATSEGSVHVLGGLQIDLPLDDRWQVSAQLGAGPYFEGNGKDLGSTFQIRSQIELGYRFADLSRLALAFSHTSNAGVADDNPGTEAVILYYHLPLTSVSP